MISFRFVAVFFALALSAPSVVAQESEAEFKGGGAAMCITAGEFLSASPDAPSGVGEDVLRWRQVLHVIDGTQEQRARAIESSRASWTELETRRPGLGAVGAQSIWTSACSDEMQIRYIAVHGSEQRARYNLAEDPTEPLDRSVAHRLNVSASYLVAAELLATERPSGRLRRALREVSPAAPDSASLSTIQERARQEILTSPGSVIGKALVAEYLRYLYGIAADGDEPQQFVNRASTTLNTRCVEQQTGPTNG